MIRATEIFESVMHELFFSVDIYELFLTQGIKATTPASIKRPPLNKYPFPE